MHAEMLCYSYTRMSSAGQITGDSDRRQFEAARAFADRNGHTLAPPLKDLGVSAFRGSHRTKGALGAFVGGLKEGKLEPGILVIEALDRLSREPPMKILGLLEDILQTGTQIHVLSSGQTITAESIAKQRGQLTNIAMYAEMAHAESVQKSERITAANRARQERARLGKKAKGAYHPPWFTRSYENGQVEHHVVPEVAASIRHIFELAACGTGALSIARILNAEGAALVPATHVRQEQRRWFQSYVGRLLTDRRVLGEYQPSRVEGDRLVPVGDPVPDYFERIITQELWDAAQAAKDPKLGGKVGGRKMVFSNLFTGMAKCAHCDGSMLMRAVYKKGSGAKSPYLRCAAAQQGLKCENRRYARLDWFEAKVLAALPGIPWRTLIRNIPAVDATQAVTAEIEQVAQEIDKLSKASARLLKVIETEDEPDDGIINRRRELVAEISELKKRRDMLIRDRNALRRNAQIDDGAVDQAVELIRMMGEANETERFVIRQKLHGILRTVIETIRFDMVSDVAWAGEAHVIIRCGLILTVPLDKTTPAQAGIYRGGWNAFAQQVQKDGIPPLIPSGDGSKLVAGEISPLARLIGGEIE